MLHYVSLYFNNAWSQTLIYWHLLTSVLNLPHIKVNAAQPEQLNYKQQEQISLNVDNLLANIHKLITENSNAMLMTNWWPQKKANRYLFCFFIQDTTICSVTLWLQLYKMLQKYTETA